MLLEGKGQEFKGKSLSEIEITVEMLEYENNEEDIKQNKSEEIRNSGKGTINSKEGDTKGNNFKTTFGKTEREVRTNFKGNNDQEPQEIEESEYYYLLPKTKRRKYTEKITVNKKIKSNRHTWSGD